MSQPHILNEETITSSNLKDGLAKIQKRDEEVSFRAGKTIDHLNQIPIVSQKDAKNQFEKIESLNVPRLKPIHINKIIDVQPRSVKELNILLSGYTLTVNKEYQQKMIDALTA